MQINLDDLTYGDLETIEKELGYVPEDFSDPSVPKVKLTMVLALVAKRKEDPSVTMDDIRAMPLGELKLEAAGDVGNDESDTGESPA